MYKKHHTIQMSLTNNISQPIVFNFNNFNMGDESPEKVAKLFQLLASQVNQIQQPSRVQLKDEVKETTKEELKEKVMVKEPETMVKEEVKDTTKVEVMKGPTLIHGEVMTKEDFDLNRRKIMMKEDPATILNKRVVMMKGLTKGSSLMKEPETSVIGKFVKVGSPYDIGNPHDIVIKPDDKVIKPNDEEQMQDVIDLIENKYIYKDKDGKKKVRGTEFLKYWKEKKQTNIDQNCWTAITGDKQIYPTFAGSSFHSGSYFAFIDDKVNNNNNTNYESVDNKKNLDEPELTELPKEYESITDPKNSLGLNSRSRDVLFDILSLESTMRGKNNNLSKPHDNLILLPDTLSAHIKERMEREGR